MMTEFIAQPNHAAYFAGTLTDAPALSQSCAHKLVSQSPKHAWAAHPRLGKHRAEATDEMDFGNIIDELVLGNSSRLAVLDVKDYRTNDAKALRDGALAIGKIPVKAEKFAVLQKVALSAKLSIEEQGVRFDGRSQCALLWVENASNGLPVQCCAMLDHLHENSDETFTIDDLKTGADCRPRKLGGKAHEYGYHIQAAAYTSGVEHVFPAAAGRVGFRNIWVESSFPYVTSLSEFDGEATQLGRVLWQRAIDKFEQCLRTGIWHGYTEPGEVLRVAMPTYATEELYVEGAGGDHSNA